MKTQIGKNNPPIQCVTFLRPHQLKTIFIFCLFKHSHNTNNKISLSHIFSLQFKIQISKFFTSSFPSYFFSYPNKYHFLHLFSLIHSKDFQIPVIDCDFFFYHPREYDSTFCEN